MPSSYVLDAFVLLLVLSLAPSVMCVFSQGKHKFLALKVLCLLCSRNLLVLFLRFLVDQLIKVEVVNEVNKVSCSLVNADWLNFWVFLDLFVNLMCCISRSL